MIKFVKGDGKTSTDCPRCIFRKESRCTKHGQLYLDKGCSNGYFTDKPSTPKRTRPRKSRDRRLLEALLRSVCIYNDGMVTWKPNQLTPQEAKQLIAIKEAMQHKGGGK